MQASYINAFLIRMVTLPKAAYRSMGVDTGHLATILEMKLSLDDRRKKTFLSRKNNTTEDKDASYGTLAFMMFLFMGALYVIPLLLINDRVTGLALSMGMMIFFLAATLITDFTSVLIDVRDNLILLPRPISDRTFVLSRLLHILVYILKVVIPMSIPTTIALGIMEGPMGILGYVLALPFLIIFTIFAVNAIYLLILRITTPERFKSIITTVQVVFAIIVYAGYQLLPRLMNMVIIESYTIPETGWGLLLPNYWFAALWKLVAQGGGSDFQVAAAMTALLLPLALIWVVVRVFAPSFNRKLGLITGSDGGNFSQGRSDKEKSLANLFSPMLCRNKAEQMGFEFTWKLTGRLRDFKLKTYPIFGYILVLLIILLLPRKGVALDEMLKGLRTEKYLHLAILYLSSLFLMTAMSTTRYTEKHGAAWIFEVAPLARPGHVIAGSVRAMLTKFFVPLFMMAVAFLVAVAGWKILPDILLSFTSQLLMIYVMVYFSGILLPFSMPQDNAQKGQSVLVNILMLLLITGIIGIHYLTKFLPVSIWILIPATLIGSIYLDRFIFRCPWEKLG